MRNVVALKFFSRTQINQGRNTLSGLFNFHTETMRFPNQRYGNIEHFRHYAAGWSVKDLAKHLKRDERTIRNWLDGSQKLPWWVPELLRLERYEKYHQMQQMNINPRLAKMGIVRGQVVDFPNLYDVRARLEKLDHRPDPIRINNDRVISELRTKKTG